MKIQRRLFKGIFQTLLQKWRMKCQLAECLVAFLPLHERALESFSFVIITIMSLTTAADPKRAAAENQYEAYP